MTTATPTFAPLSVALAADADATMADALAALDRITADLAEARERKRDAEVKLKDREIEVSLSAFGGKNAEERKLAAADAVRQDSHAHALRTTVITSQNALDRLSDERETALKRFAHGRAVLEYQTAVALLYARGGQLSG